MKPIISIIAAKAKNNIIGCNNTLPWKISEDLKHFREITTNHIVIMGRKTFESIGKPLPNRTNIILTRDINYKQEGCLIFSNLTDILYNYIHEDEIFFIGGGEIYKLILPIANKLYLTEVQENFIGDTYFPDIDVELWKETKRDIRKPDDTVEYHFVEYEHIGNV